MIWDTHAHLDDEQFDQDLSAVLERAKEAGITQIINPGHSETSSRNSVKIAGKYDFIYAAVGIHPHNAKDCTENTWELLNRLAQNPKVIAWGEIGLDYFRDLSPRELQQKHFIQQIELANEAGLPIIVHNRDAHADLLKIIKQYRPENGGVFHSYSGSWEMAKELLKMEFYLSFSGPLTYKNARHAVEVAQNVPPDRFLLETDSPYLPPEPYRGKRNEPAHVKLVLKKLAELKGLSLEETARLSTENVKRLFRLA
ncbi:hydrolase, TatD family [Syntrophobotulus glycolicus DSM 8271]|uniref:Hydrolase, TatD family n=1 Tax=Syntrophobotulus glycolicus (strain DSM 8271 / FlGlyR) TaxID=645991 RepID=F0SW60_SYNGF|nr:TatD family hydrolase [Syntrophobotulus glycolicus]ADY54546.1 hydrolase, TatD family [Syntrophobotulus glycolicus DSM 8271]